MTVVVVVCEFSTRFADFFFRSGQPFREQYPVNPSWEIARGLPSYLPPLRAKDISSRRGAVELPPVRILVRPEPIRVNYKAVREVVPGFWDDEYMGHKIDVAVHIGMAGPQLQYAIERRGHRTGYKSLDVDGEALEDEQEGQHGDDWIWNGLPDELLTNLDLDDVFMRWQSHCPVSRHNIIQCLANRFKNNESLKLTYNITPARSKSTYI